MVNNFLELLTILRKLIPPILILFSVGVDMGYTDDIIYIPTFQK